MEATVTDHRLAGVPDLVTALGDLDLRLLGPELDAERRRLRSLVGGYLLPRSAAPDGPLVLAIVGESGSGKSTIVDSLANHPVSPTGALRPTTVQAVAWAAEPLPGTLDDLRREDALRVVVGGSGPPEGVVIVDTPPPDRGEGSTAADVLDRADVCVLVTSGLRYADAGSWRLLRQAVHRQLPVVVVLNRLPEDPAAQEALAGDLARRLVDVGVAAEPSRAPLVTVAEGPISHDTGGLPPEWISRVRKEIDAFADLASRRSVIRHALKGARRSAERGLRFLREAMLDASLVRGELASIAEEAYAHEAGTLREALLGGAMADLGSGSAVLAGDLAAMLAWRANLASRRTADAWQSRPAGARLLDERPDLWTHGPGTFEEARERFTDWDRSLGDLVLDTMARRRMGRHRLSRYAGLVRREALDDGYRPRGRSGRRRRRGLADSPEVARRWLVQIAEELLDRDASRFREALGSVPTGDVLRRLTLPEAVLDG